jgi:hypothetical protein
MESTLDLSKLAPNYNADLTIVLRIFLKQGASTGSQNDSDSTAFAVQPWKPAEWASFTSSFQRLGQQFWNGKFWLERPYNPEYPPLLKNGYYHNIYCRFKLEVVHSAASADKTIQVVKLKVPPGKHYNASTFRSNDSLYDNFDLGWASYKRGGRTYRQETFIHEIGHAIGLPHIAVMTGEAVCKPADTNADPCYGVTTAERKDIMGFGHALSLRDALPWQKRMQLHTKIKHNDWKASLRHIPPVHLMSKRCEVKDWF